MPTPAPGPSQTQSTPQPSASATPAVRVRPSGEPVTIETGLKAPWSMVNLPSGSTLISERDTGVIRERLPRGGLRQAGFVRGVVHAGESGLLGLAVQAGHTPGYLYIYLTTANDNRVIRERLMGGPGSYSLGDPENVVVGIPKASFHDGGRIAFGPDGMLYITTGDAGAGAATAQSKDSLGGKILRVTPTGAVPADNPFAGSPVYSFGHRNPQGIAWDSHGTLWASEFGQNTWDELNRITPGGNYGWPAVEGIGHNPAYIDPVYQWRTNEASPSGIAIIKDTIFMAALRGQRLWAIYPGDAGAAVTAVEWYPDAYGRIRDVIAGPSGTLWMLTNNTDGRGTARAGDDRILEVALEPTG
jgi:glucose/arabinose dehydrogenase